MDTLHEPRIIELWVPGIPRPQGSKRAFALPNGRISMAEMSKKLPAWRSDVRTAGISADVVMFTDAVKMTCNFVFPRPKSHWGTGKNAEVLKPDAPTYVTKVPDLSKLVRGIEDALEGVLYDNDSQICEISTTKAFGPKSGVWIAVEEL
jgi:Holliday junction resolvase RusA-like endonuclease